MKILVLLLTLVLIGCGVQDEKTSEILCRNYGGVKRISETLNEDLLMIECHTGVEFEYSSYLED